MRVTLRHNLFRDALPSIPRGAHVTEFSRALFDSQYPSLKFIDQLPDPVSMQRFSYPGVQNVSANDRTPLKKAHMPNTKWCIDVLYATGHFFVRNQPEDDIQYFARNA